MRVYLVFVSPLSSSPNLLALGAKDSGASGFDDYGGELEILNLDFKEPGLGCPAAGKVRLSVILFWRCFTSDLLMLLLFRVS